MFVSQLYDLKLKIEERINSSGADPKDVKGKLGLRSGILLSLINSNTPDNPDTIAKLKQAAKEVLNVTL
jgi:hypothetical protein